MQLNLEINQNSKYARSHYTGWCKLMLLLLFCTSVQLSYGQAVNCLCNNNACPTTNLVNFTTGLDGSTLMPYQSSDPEWRIVAVNGIPTIGFISVVRAPGTNWMNPVNNIFGRWVGLGWPVQTPGDTYTFEYCMDMCSSSGNISGFDVFAHEEIAAIRLNSTAVYTSPGYTTGSTNDYQNGIRITGQVINPNVDGQVCLQIDVNTHTNMSEPAIFVKGRAIGTFVDSNCANNSNAVAGFLFHDRNANGTQDFAETPLANWTVRLKDTQSGQVLATATTDNTGYYNITNLTPGNRTVSVDIQSAWIATIPAGSSSQVTLTSCDALDLNFGLRSSDTPIPANDCTPPDPSCTTNVINLDTGIDYDNQVLIAPGGSDPFWTVTNVPTGSLFTVGASASVHLPNGAWHPNSSRSQWLTPSDYGADGGAMAGCPYTYQRCFSTCDSGAVNLDFRVFSDDFVSEIRVNGSPVVSYNPPSSSYSIFSTLGFPVISTLTLGPGLHCIEVDVINGPDGNGNPTPTGFKLEGIVSGSKLLKDGCSAQTRCPIIALDASMMQGQNAGRLVDTQWAIGDPVNGQLGNPGSPWQLIWPNTVDVGILDLGEIHDLCDIYLYDYPHHNGDFMIEYEDINAPGTWLSLLVRTAMTQNLLVPANVRTERLRFTLYQGGLVNEIVVYGSPTSRSGTYKIPLDASMFGSPSVNADDLVDEQGHNPYANPASPGPTMPWTYNNGCWINNPCNPAPNNNGNCTPITAEMDLGRLYKLDAVCLFDGTDCGDFGVEYDDNGVWMPLPGIPGGLFNTGSYLEWRIFDNLQNVYTSKLRFTKMNNQSEIGEVILYGRAVTCTPAGGIVPLIAHSTDEIALTDEKASTKRAFGELMVYPNPVSELVTVALPQGHEAAGQLSIYNLHGQLLRKVDFAAYTPKLSLSLTDLAPGMYLINVTSGDASWSHKVVKR